MAEEAPRFIVDGIEYASIDEVPDEHRQVIRDALRTAEVTGGDAQHDVAISVDGIDYSNLGDLPEPQREMVANVLADRDGDGVLDIIESLAPMQRAIVRRVMADRDGDGIPDIMEGGPSPSRIPPRQPETPSAARQAYSLEPVVEDDPHLGRGAWISIIVVIAVVVGIVIGRFL